MMNSSKDIDEEQRVDINTIVSAILDEIKRIVCFVDDYAECSFLYCFCER
jgi:hypothetical protein